MLFAINNYMVVMSIPLKKINERIFKVQNTLTCTEIRNVNFNNLIRCAYDLCI